MLYPIQLLTYLLVNLSLKYYILFTKKIVLKLNKNKLATNLIYTFAIPGHVMCSPIAPTLSAIIFAHVEKATQEMAINAQI